MSNESAYSFNAGSRHKMTGVSRVLFNRKSIGALWLVDVEARSHHGVHVDFT